MKTKSWKAIQRKLFTRDEVVAAERFAKREILELKLRKLRQTDRKTQKRHA
jgi:hypothetical protein